MSIDKHLYIGTSGWVYKKWGPLFFPKEVKERDHLTYYATEFKSVEVNATFYRTLTEAMVNSWNRQLPKKFHLALKGARYITHIKRLKNCKESLKIYFERVFDLKNVHVILWQLPPSFKQDLNRLESFLKLLPKGVRHAVEFRHVSWWNEETATLLRKFNAAFVAVSHPGLPADFFHTANFIYVRFHGLSKKNMYNYKYIKKDLQRWVPVLSKAAQKEDVYIYFNNDFEYAPANALLLQGLVLKKK